MYHPVERHPQTMCHIEAEIYMKYGKTLVLRIETCEQGISIQMTEMA